MIMLYVNFEMEIENYNVEFREVCEFEFVLELMIYLQGCYDQFGFVVFVFQNWDFGIQGLN